MAIWLLHFSHMANNDFFYNFVAEPTLGTKDWWRDANHSKLIQVDNGFFCEIQEGKGWSLPDCSYFKPCFLSL